jgi:hypothetical protein
MNFFRSYLNYVYEWKRTKISLEILLILKEIISLNRSAEFFFFLKGWRLRETVRNGQVRLLRPHCW